jgi:hypothetical protein
LLFAADCQLTQLWYLSTSFRTSWHKKAFLFLGCTFIKERSSRLIPNKNIENLFSLSGEKFTVFTHLCAEIKLSFQNCAVNRRKRVKNGFSYSMRKDCPFYPSIILREWGIYLLLCRFSFPSTPPASSSHLLPQLYQDQRHSKDRGISHSV